ncbi:MAG: ribonuclease [Sphingopyxis sp.]
MAEWVFEDGIGERRAALVDGGQIIECVIERDGDGVGAGAIASARILSREEGGMHMARLPSGEEALLSTVPPGISIGADVLVEVTRSAVPERDMVKRTKCRPAPEGAVARPAPTLFERICATGTPVRTLHPHEDDALEDAGWSAWMDVALSGNMAFAGGMLRAALTPAMAVIDVDGTVAAAELARAGAAAAARMIRALGISGNIVIDLPTQGNKEQRIAAAEAFDAEMPQPFERTAVNGYGLLQIIRPRRGPSIAERWQFAPAASAALALLRRAERHAVHSQKAGMALAACATEIAWVEARPALVDMLGTRTGKCVSLRSDAALGMGHGYAD